MEINFIIITNPVLKKHYLILKSVVKKHQILWRKNEEEKNS
jgi:hypothetical protein